MPSSASPPGLSPCQIKAWEILTASRANIFLTGGAGTGKSHLVRAFLGTHPSKVFPVVASTGVAAVLVGGRTFHSFFGLGIMEGGFEATVKRALEDGRVRRRLRRIEGFVLDEVSMVPGTALRAAEAVCRAARENDDPWGGARIVAVGDFAQLPPVTRGGPRDWAFNDAIWEQSGFARIILKTPLRTDDAEYLRVLEAVRSGVIDDATNRYLDARVDLEPDVLRTTCLFPRRAQAESHNLARLGELEAAECVFETVYSGREKAVAALRASAPVTEVLRLKPGAFVMVRVNDRFGTYVNGSTGVLEDIGSDKLFIKLDNGRIVEIGEHEFSFLDAEGKIAARAVNFPVTLAYALTIHKSQGMTLKKMVADLRGLWEPGQAYVALSRLTSGNGLTLAGWSERSVRTDPEVVRFYGRGRA